MAACEMLKSQGPLGAKIESLSSHEFKILINDLSWCIYRIYIVVNIPKNSQQKGMSQPTSKSGSNAGILKLSECLIVARVHLGGKDLPLLPALGRVSF